eukprot:8658546-Ditylum_brightwellii.AAC.1
MSPTMSTKGRLKISCFWLLAPSMEVSIHLQKVCRVYNIPLFFVEYLEKRGQTSIVVSVDGRSEAVTGFIDKAKEEALVT